MLIQIQTPLFEQPNGSIVGSNTKRGHWKNRFTTQSGLLKNSARRSSSCSLLRAATQKSLLIRWVTSDGQLHHDDWSSNALSWQRCLFSAFASVKRMHEWVCRVCWAHLPEYITGRGCSKGHWQSVCRQVWNEKRPPCPSTLCQCWTSQIAQHKRGQQIKQSELARSVCSRVQCSKTAQSNVIFKEGIMKLKCNL